MNKKIYRLDWDSGIIDEITKWLRCREIGQQFMYFGNGSENYCDYLWTFFEWDNLDKWKLDNSPWGTFFNEHGIIKWCKRDIYIWVACGDSKREIAFLKEQWNKNMLYIGVDLSSEMIDLSEENLKKEELDYILIQSDIFNPGLLKQIDLLINSDDRKSFLFLGWTFWNFRTTSITDLLGWYMKKGEKLYIDIFMKDDSVESDFALHQHYLDKLVDWSKWIKHIISGFTYVDFPIEKWEIVIHTENDKEVWLFGVYHSLKLLENVEFKLNDNLVIFSKWEEIRFHCITYYEIFKLINFMKIHHFHNSLKSISTGVLGQFLFEKE